MVAALGMFKSKFFNANRFATKGKKKKKHLLICLISLVNGLVAHSADLGFKHLVFARFISEMYQYHLGSCPLCEI